MRIIVDIYQGEDGRPAGTVRADGRPQGWSFSGNLEFLALVENLCRANESPSALREFGTDEGDNL